MLQSAAFLLLTVIAANVTKLCSVYSLATEVGKEGSGEKRKRSFRKNAMILG